MSPDIYAIVPAAGVGSRMNSAIAKQYLVVNGKTILEHSIDALEKIVDIKKIIVVVSAEDDIWPTLDALKKNNIYTTLGGRSRADSVANGIKFIEKNFLISHEYSDKAAWALVHDAARPCVNTDCVQQLIAQCISQKTGGILAYPVADTVKKQRTTTKLPHNSEAIVESTQDRSVLWLAQTPQLFPFKNLQNALAYCCENNIAVTDEASAIEAVSEPVQLVMSTADNIKITREQDLIIATAILANRNNKV